MILREDMPSSGRSDAENLADPSRWTVVMDEGDMVTLSDGRMVMVVPKVRLKEFLEGEGRKQVLEEGGG